MALNYSDEESFEVAARYYETEIKPNLFAVSRIFAEARKQMTLPEYQTLALALSRINWTGPCPDTLYIDKKELAVYLGMQADADHLSQNLKRAVGLMPRHSFLEFNDWGKQFYVSGNFVRTVALFRNVVRIRLEDEFLGLFGNLDGKEEVSKYVTMWSGDVQRMRTERSVLFYELLRENSDTRLLTQEGTVSVKKFKELFGIPKDGKGSYMREKGGFDRSKFEKRVIDPICEDLKDTRMIKLIVQPDGKYYEKVKKGNRVIAYRFMWIITTMPRVVSATEDQAVQERQIKNPGLMKIASDILTGEKRQYRQDDHQAGRSHAKQKNQFVEMETNNYDFNALEEELLALSDAVMAEEIPGQMTIEDFPDYLPD